MADLIIWGLAFILANYGITRALDALISRINDVSLIIKWKSNWQRYNQYYKERR